jgi:hypothetical protein
MKLNGIELDINKLVEDNVKHNFLKDYGNGIYLNDNHTQVLDRYHINYKNCTSMEELIFKIEEYLNDDYFDDLEMVQKELSEYYYYHDINK